jgi:hypothetical protein
MGDGGFTQYFRDTFAFISDQVEALRAIGAPEHEAAFRAVTAVREALGHSAILKWTYGEDSRLEAEPTHASTILRCPYEPPGLGRNSRPKSRSEAAGTELGASIIRSRAI